ncbi:MULTISPECIES: MarR family transcriptional regulator [Brevibacillus]|uniref:MarR family winged helix-turn-helix transcriptional regulator n=1 Tax=Brevibacillus TaxID=55080 RepID=UPI00203AC6C5|nr:MULTISPECIES: MarR family transcriptional regulator [Brevibacillus]MCM3082088.1 MarR family transcriptional regulator [Brevibacillus invocatus]MCM3432499.1 MarR family transcriptional regulator [Brevibacillus invocatus]MDH4619049.1 MarR family transcriptional regulator [Brevibacillus sp. AY1]
MSNPGKLTELEDLYIQIQRRVSAEWHKRLDTLISGSQALILRILHAHGPQKVSAIAERLDITPGAVTSLADKLIACGYADRKRDTADRRVVYLEITDQGHEILLKYRAELKRTVEEFFVGLSDEDLQHLTRIYTQLLKNIEQRRGEKE